jgi:hypothetical protein
VADLEEPVLDTADDVMAALADLMAGRSLQQFAIPAAVQA